MSKDILVSTDRKVNNKIVICIDNKTTETLFINDLLENIKILIKYIIAQKRRKLKKMKINLKQKNTKKIPKLRFGGFDGGWEEKKLGEVCSFTQGIQIPQNEQLRKKENGYIRYLYIRDFFTDNFPCYVRDLYSNKIIKEEEIMVVNTGNTAGKVFTGSTGVLSNNCFKISFDKKMINGKFLFLCLTSEKIQNKIKSFFNSGGQPHLGHNNIALVLFAYSSLKEQQKIASFLGCVDKWLENLREQKKNFGDYKKGMMQKIFSQEIRFKNENGKNFSDWEEKKLGEVGKTYNGLSGKSGEDFGGEGEFFITYKQIFDRSEINIEKFALVKIGIKEKQNKAQFGDLFFTTSSETPLEVGFSSVLLNKDVAPYLNSFSFGFRPNSLKLLDPYFSKFYFRSSFFRREIVKLAQGSTRYNISKIGFMKIKMLVPKFKEQQKIANFLTSIDKSIELKQQQITQAQQWKKGLMQGLFV